MRINKRYKIITALEHINLNNKDKQIDNLVHGKVGSIENPAIELVTPQDTVRGF